MPEIRALSADLAAENLGRSWRELSAVLIFGGAFFRAFRVRRPHFLACLGFDGTFRGRGFYVWRRVWRLCPFLAALLAVVCVMFGGAFGGVVGGNGFGAVVGGLRLAPVVGLASVFDYDDASYESRCPRTIRPALAAAALQTAATTLVRSVKRGASIGPGNSGGTCRVVLTWC